MSEEKSWWSRRSTLEKSLIDIVVIGFLLSIGLLVGLIIVAVRGNNEDDSCKTKNCVETSAKILSKMDLTIDPCENFYEFACGNFLRETVIPDDKASITPFNIIEDELRIQLRKIVLETPKQNEILPFQNVRKLFNMCMNTTEIGSLENVPLLNVLETLGGWPVLDDSWDDSEWSWQTFHAQSKQYGFKILSLFEILVDTDFKETTKRVVVIDQPTLGLEREYLIKALDEPYVRAYQQYQVDLAILLGAQPTKAQNEMQQALEFEFKLAEISKSREERRDAMVDYNKLTVAELQSRFPYNNWLEYLNSILPEKVQLKSEDSVVTFNIDFLEKIGNLLSSSSKRDVANYLSWLVVMNSVNFLPNKLRERKHEFDKILTGKEEQEVRWQECIDVTLEQYAHAFGALYVRRHFNREAKKIVLEMVDNIKTEFDANLNTIDWMDDETRKIAKAKLLAMTEEIGFADELLDNDKVNELYKDFPALIDGQYFNSISKLKSAAIDKSLLKLSAPVNTSDWTEQLPPAIVMAYYYSLENTIKFPAAFLQGVFFNPDRPQYTNYGAVGLAIGHEITHGFDDQGSQFDADGNLNEWWAPETKQKFLEKAKCIVEQYSNFTEPQTNLRVNGINTQGENIADNGGVKYAYRGYNQWVAKNGAEQKLPGLDYTALQLFWISVGQMWCSVSRDEEMKNTILLGDHSPAEFRVVGPVSNSEDFAKDFNCKRASRMNPVDKCDVW